MIPSWLKKKVPKGANQKKIREFLDPGVHTVCEEALCPNRGECFASGTVTFLILGDKCTRSCRFCATQKLTPQSQGTALDQNEPKKVAISAQKLKLEHVVITSVTRDDLPDGGATQFAKTIEAVQDAIPGASIEVLTPDFGGNTNSLNIVLKALPLIFNHNVETVARLYPTIRPQADLEQSLAVLKYAKENSHCYIKSGLMVGLGETVEEVHELLAKLKNVGVDIVTIGQYLAPSKEHAPVIEYVHPDKFTEYQKYGESIGIKYVFAGPFVRSSYLAKEVIQKIKVSPNELCW